MSENLVPFTRLSVRPELGQPTPSKEDRRTQRRFVLLAETFQALGDYSRLQIVHLLTLSEKCVGGIARELSMSQPAVSHHLRTLRQLNLVKTRRNGRNTYYSLDDQHIEHLLLEGFAHVEELL